MTGAVCASLRDSTDLALWWPVYLRWYLWKVGLERTQWYLINGLTMTVVFFLCRNAYGLGAKPFAVVSSPKLLHSCSMP